MCKEVKDLLSNIGVCHKRIEECEKEIKINIQDLLKTEEGQKQLFNTLSLNMFLTLSFLDEKDQKDLIAIDAFSGKSLIDIEGLAEKYLNDKFFGDMLRTINLTYIGEESSLLCLNFDSFYLYLVDEQRNEKDSRGFVKYYIDNQYETYSIIKEYVKKNFEKIKEEYIKKYLLLDTVEYINLSVTFIPNHQEKVKQLEEHFNVTNILDTNVLEPTVDAKALYKYVKEHFIFKR